MDFSFCHELVLSVFVVLYLNEGVGVFVLSFIVWCVVVLGRFEILVPLILGLWE